MKAFVSPMMWLATAMLLLCGCKERTVVSDSLLQENQEARHMLQGIWINSDGDDIAFRVKGDTISYPDSTSQAVSFKVYADTMVLYGATVVKYPIVKLAPHLFMFRNPYGDIVKLVKSEDPADNYFFSRKQAAPVNQNRLIKRDTLISYGGKRYHCYVQVNPTSYKVMKTTYTDEGVAVNNVYYDNIVHLSIFLGTERLFSRDFHKKDFSRLVPQPFLRQSVLSDMTFLQADTAGIHYKAEVRIPDSSLSYIVETVIAPSGKYTMQIRR